MDFKSKVEETLKKKALGFSYVEEVEEFELIKPKNYLYCENRGRLYLKNGYIKVEKIEENNQLKGLDFKKICGLKAFKIKGSCFFKKKS